MEASLSCCGFGDRWTHLRPARAGSRVLHGWRAAERSPPEPCHVIVTGYFNVCCIGLLTFVRHTRMGQETAGRLHATGVTTVRGTADCIRVTPRAYYTAVPHHATHPVSMAYSRLPVPELDKCTIAAPSDTKARAVHAPAFLSPYPP